jgi:hypothetical protein
MHQRELRAKGRGGWQACSMASLFLAAPSGAAPARARRSARPAQTAGSAARRPPCGGSAPAQARPRCAPSGQLAGDRAQHRLRVVRGHCARRHDMMLSIRMTRVHARPPRLMLHLPRLQAVGTKVGTESTLCSPHGSGSPQRVSAHTGTQEALCANAQQKEVLQQWRAAPPHACKQPCTDALAPVAQDWTNSAGARQRPAGPARRAAARPARPGGGAARRCRAAAPHSGAGTRPAPRRAAACRAPARQCGAACAPWSARRSARGARCVTRAARAVTDRPFPFSRTVRRRMRRMQLAPSRCTTQAPYGAALFLTLTLLRDRQHMQAEPPRRAAPAGWR